MNREDAWIRRRIRKILVVSWKRKHTCFKALMALTDAEWQLIQVLGNGRKVGSLIVAEKDLNYAGNYD